MGFIEQHVEDITVNNTQPAIHYEKRYILSKRRKRLIRFLLFPVCLGLLVMVGTLGYRGYKVYVHKKEVEDLQTQIAEMEQAIEKMAYDIENAKSEVVVEPEPQILPKFAELYEQNSDIAGWLSIPDTEISYPIMYLDGDNDYYLSHNFGKEEDKNGLLVLDKRCNPSGDDVNWLIHGHNKKSGAMFGTLKYYTDEDYYISHPQIEISTLYENRTYEIMAVFRSSVYNDETTDFEYYEYIQINDTHSFDEYIEGIKEIALYDTGVTASWGDKLVTLSTCEYSKKNGRLVIVGREEK
ncbi:class B sortase [Pseudobutyrivibrio xylanivorans]|uniref:Class B sortase n=1 Tax=Pseudobutyrivibrio xylanivorans TaxID=185007 RepID=A0A5P6VTW5_PSEXY|nr:class B sortase [Pseudobutyrivibrio xylanivorans]QFJ55758.1 class B sortase [Pseudobutyrivibrio xylanivorans]